MNLNQGMTADAIYKYYESIKHSERRYLGWSEVGHKCDRYLWLSFRKAFVTSFPGRVLRLFETGFREEDRVLENLRQIGCEVKCDDGNGNQVGVESYNGHLRGHVDAIVKGLPESPKTWHLVDVKTINLANYKKLQKDSMESVFPKYWAQAHGYMSELKLKRAMYIFVVKDNDTIHTERFNFDKKTYEYYKQRAINIIESGLPLAPLSNNPQTWYECKFCPARDLCLEITKPIQHCRNCDNIKPVKEGEWFCILHESIVPHDDMSYQHKCYSCNWMNLL